MKYLALKVPGLEGKQVEVEAPAGVPEVTLENLVSFGVNILFVIGIILTLIFLIWGGILWITSQGDEEKVKKARKTLTYAIIGIVVILLSAVIIQFVGTLLGIDFVANLGAQSN